MKIFFTTKAVQNYTMNKELSKSYGSYFHTKRILFFYIVTEETIPDLH